MNKLLFTTIFLFFFSCQKLQKSKNSSDQQVPISKTRLENIDKASSINLTFPGQLSDKKIDSIFTIRVKRAVGIKYKIDDVYNYKDSIGEHYMVLTKHVLSINEEKDTLYDQIIAFDLTHTENEFKKRFIVKDAIDIEWETSIWFWTKYSEISDFDNDGLTDIILVYGTGGQDLYTDGKIKIVIYSNRKKTSIRHQNSDIDSGRYTKIKKAFYKLPIKIQNVVKEKMRLMAKNGHAQFSMSWEKEIANKAARIEGK